ncbi:MAG: TusE/DsrC/DsvC family sulfur relay protein [Gammaproteobacteria bacterium]|nr:TusE/DsrC/DsvC family sulfur relay protein [Gammaproteobacteria bacterium]
MDLQVEGRSIRTDEENFLCNPAEWSTEVADAIAAEEGLDLKDDHLGLIDYFREFYEETGTHPSMHQLVQSLGAHLGERFHDHRAFATHLYHIFPSDPVCLLCKLAGLPKPQACDHDG